MPITGSGQVSLGDIQTEFGGSNPIGMSEYYGKGNAPASSGEMQLAADFYGTSDVSFTAATGGSVATDGDYKVHTFISSGNFNV